MKTLQVNDEVYESLKAFVVDPFDDTPDVVLMRLVDVAHKAQSRWCPFDARSEDRGADGSVPPGTRGTPPKSNPFHRPGESSSDSSNFSDAASAYDKLINTDLNSI